MPILFKIYGRYRRPERTSVSASPVQCWYQMVMRKLDVIIFVRNVRLTVLPLPLDIVAAIESSFMRWQHFVKPCTSLPCIFLNFRLWLYKHTRYLFMIEFCHFLPGIPSWCGDLTSAISLMPLLYGELGHYLILHLEVWELARTPGSFHCTGHGTIHKPLKYHRRKVIVNCCPLS